MPSIHFLPDDKIVEIQTGESILRASLRAGIPHTYVCGGNARCTTCRVLLVDGDESSISPINESETLIANKFGFATNIRLACQSYVSNDISIRRLVIDDADIALARLCSECDTLTSTGKESHVVVLFADIRDFTSFSEKQLPYDVIHMLNRYFHQMRNIIERNNGYIYNYMGDGLLALFGVDDPTHAMEDSVRSGLEMLQAMDDMQPYLQRTYKQNLQIGVGIHSGDVVIGTIDDSLSDKKMVIGDAVNFASRIESSNKKVGTRLLVSQPVHNNLQDKLEIGKTCSVEIKGKSGEHQLYEVLSLT